MQRPMEGRKESSFVEAEEAVAAASPAAATILAFLARPLSLLRHVAHGLASRLKPASASAPACRPQQEEAAAAAVVVTEEEVVVVEMRSRGMRAPQRPRGLREGRGGNGGAHH